MADRKQRILSALNARRRQARRVARERREEATRVRRQLRGEAVADPEKGSVALADSTGAVPDGQGVG